MKCSRYLAKACIGRETQVLHEAKPSKTQLGVKFKFIFQTAFMRRNKNSKKAKRGFLSAILRMFEWGMNLYWIYRSMPSEWKVKMFQLEYKIRAVRRRRVPLGAVCPPPARKLYLKFSIKLSTPTNSIISSNELFISAFSFIAKS